MGKQKGCKDLSLNGFSLVKLVTFEYAIVPSKCSSNFYIREETGFYFCEHPI